MNRKSLHIAFALLVAAFSPVFGQTYGPGVVDKSIAVIGNEVIMVSQIESEAQMMRARGAAVDATDRCDILEQMLVSKRLKAEGLDAKLLLQIHDELLVEVRKDMAERAAEIVSEEMRKAAELPSARKHPYPPRLRFCRRRLEDNIRLCLAQ